MNHARAANSPIQGFLSRKGLGYAVALTHVMVSIASADTLFKCKDADGQTHFQDAKCPPTQDVSSRELNVTPVVKQVASAPKMVTTAYVIIKASTNKGFFLMGSINNTSVPMMVDTGATSVAIPENILSTLRFRCDSSVNMQTANGEVSTCKGTVDSLQIGNIILRDVEAMGMPAGQFVLLGQSALNRLKVEQEQGVMKLSARVN